MSSADEARLRLLLTSCTLTNIRVDHLQKVHLFKIRAPRVPFHLVPNQLSYSQPKEQILPGRRCWPAYLSAKSSEGK